MRHIHRSGPIITHCSAGIGRSGTLICIDTVLGLISKDADVSRQCNKDDCFHSDRSNNHFHVVWYFRCCEEHETSEAWDGSDWGGFSFQVSVLLYCVDSDPLCFIFLSGPVYFLLSSDPLCPQMPSSRGKHLRIITLPSYFHHSEAQKRYKYRADMGKSWQITLHVLKFL